MEADKNLSQLQKSITTMKKIHEFIDQWSSSVEDRWKLLAPRKQRKYILMFFAAYILITMGAMFITWYEGQKTDASNSEAIRHIRNPLLNHNNQIRQPL